MGKRGEGGDGDYENKGEEIQEYAGGERRRGSRIRLTALTSRVRTNARTH